MGWGWAYVHEWVTDATGQDRKDRGWDLLNRYLTFVFRKRPLKTPSPPSLNPCTLNFIKAASPTSPGLDLVYTQLESQCPAVPA